MHNLTKASLVLDDAVWDTHLAAQVGEPHNELNNDRRRRESGEGEGEGGDGEEPRLSASHLMCHWVCVAGTVKCDATQEQTHTHTSEQRTKLLVDALLFP